MVNLIIMILWCVCFFIVCKITFSKTNTFLCSLIARKDYKEYKTLLKLEDSKFIRKNEYEFFHPLDKNKIINLLGYGVVCIHHNHSTEVLISSYCDLSKELYSKLKNL